VLIGIDPLLRGPLLSALDLMGHGDSLVIADANFPAWRLGRVVFDLPGTSSAAVARAVLSVFPLDPVEAATLMAAPVEFADVQREITEVVSRFGNVGLENVDRFAFYELAREASVIVSTGEKRPYGNLIVRKGGINQ
jgi:L-fucose mutarotase